MKQLPEVNASFENLYGMLIAPIKSKLLLTGIELGVFNQLSKPRTSDAMAAAIESHPENTRLFLDGLAACDLITKKNGLYRNTEIAQEFLVEGHPTYMGPMFTITAQTFFALDDLPKLVKEGPPPPPSPEADMASEQIWAQFTAAMANAERAGAAQQAARIVSKLPEFPSFKKMLDLVISYYYMRIDIAIISEKVNTSLKSSIEAWTPIVILILLILFGLFFDNHIVKSSLL